MTGFLAALAFLQVFLYRKKRCLLRGIFFTVLSGLSALFLCSFLEPYLGFSLPVTAGTMKICAVLGMPGAILLLLGQIFLQLI